MADYNRFRHVIAQVPIEHRQAFEEKLIREGRLLPSRQGKRGVTDNVFEDALREFLAETYQETADARSPEAAESLAEELVADAEELQSNQQGDTTKKRKKPTRHKAPGK